MIKWMRLGLFSGPLVLHANHILKKRKKHPEKYSLEDRSAVVHRYARKLSAGGFRISFVIEGEENLLKEQALYVGNHRSVIDPILFYAVSDMPLTVVAKKEVESMPVFGSVVKCVDGFFLDRENLRSELKTFLSIQRKFEECPDLSLIIYPEGTRSKAPDFPLLPFHAGTFKLATKKGLPIVPVCMVHTDRVLNQKMHYRCYPIQVSILPPIREEEYSSMTGEQIATLVHDRMEKEIKRLEAREESLIMEKNGYSRKKAQKVMKYRK